MDDQLYLHADTHFLVVLPSLFLYFSVLSLFLVIYCFQRPPDSRGTTGGWRLAVLAVVVVVVVVFNVRVFVIAEFELIFEYVVTECVWCQINEK